MSTTRALLFTLSIAFLVTGCVRPQQLSATPDGIWIKEPVISVGSTDAMAEKHCARFGKTAVRASEIVGNKGDWRDPVDRSQHLPIQAYDCK